MTHSQLRLPFVIVLFTVVLLFTPNSIAQTCDAGGGFGDAIGGDSAGLFCDIDPTDIYSYGGNGAVVATCVGCVRGGDTPFPHSGGFSHGGTQSCTRFSKTMVINFSQPVANAWFEVYGAHRVTDNLGHSYYLDPPLDSNGAPRAYMSVFIPGPGITRISVSEPIEYTIFNEIGKWEMNVLNGWYLFDSTYHQCNCSAVAISAPAPESLIADTQSPWAMDVEVSADSGLVLKNVRLNGRYMAERMSVPYFTVQTSTMAAPLKGRLKPNGGDALTHSRLVYYNVLTNDTKRVIEARYLVDQILDSFTDCVLVTQRYEFYKPVPGDNCEPSSTVPCARWKPIIEYNYRPGSGAQLQSMQFAQRFHFQNNGAVGNSVGLFRDCNNSPLLGGCMYALGGYLFYDKWNPVGISMTDRVIGNGKDSGTWDNFHLTFLDAVAEPATFPHLLSPGCPECVHFHWRWGAHISGFGDGKPLIPDGSNQDVDIGVVLFVPPAQNSQQEENELHSGTDLIRTLDDKPLDVSFWYWSTGHQQSDRFSPTQGGFFNPSFAWTIKPITEALPPGQPAQSPRQPNSVVPLSSQTDAPESVTFADLYTDGDATYSAVDPATVGPLPAGYSVLDDDAYDITTDATVSGPHVVMFSVPSVTNQSTFNSLRILHVVPDSFDPEKARFEDPTIIAPQTPAPDFANKKISAKVDGLGVFLITTFSPPPPNTDSADVSVNVTHSPTTLNAGTNLTYTLNVTNNGPQTAHEVILKNTLPREANFVSVTPSAGTCRKQDSAVLCTIDALAFNGTATITIQTTPTEGLTPFPPEGKILSNATLIKANEPDPAAANNSFVDEVTVLPDGNAGPSINISAPLNNSAFTGPVNLTIAAMALDSNGTIDRVEFYENGSLLGLGSPAGTNQYNFTWNNAAGGSHRLIAVAVDNLGKARASEPVNVAINSATSVSIITPANWANFNTPPGINVTASASISGGTISSVGFYDDGVLIGTATSIGTNQYGFTWTAPRAGRHLLTAMATDNSGLTAISPPVNFTVNEPPAIRLLSPVSSTVLTTVPATIALSANASDWEGTVLNVEFYANGVNVGTATSGPYVFNYNWTNVQPGTYSITAVASDDFDLTTTSAPVSIRVNAAPNVSITAPVSGSQFAEPANITLTATATDSDGTIANVAFFADGVNIGNGASIGGNQYSLMWSGVAFGSYAITAVATDNDAKTTSVVGPNVSVTTPVLFVTGSTTLNASDTVVKSRLEALGHSVVVKDGASAVTADATGKALVLISSTVTPTAVGTKFRTVAVPVITWESGSFNNMGMTGSTNKDFGTKTGQTQITITNSGHPLAAGLSGSPTIVSAARTLDWGKPNANAISIATVLGDSAKTTIFAYEPGVAMPGLMAPARRLGLFLYDDSGDVLNSSGSALLDAGIKWARGGGSLTGSFVISPVGSVNLTSEGSIDWAHWGRNGPTAFDHKANVVQKIPNVTKVGAGASNWFTDCPTTFTWTDGMPTVSISNTPTGINTNGSVGNGYEISVPADRTTRTLKLYVGVWFTQGKLQATLSDGSAPDFVDTSLNKNNDRASGLYTITYRAASASQTLKVRFTILTQYFSPNGNVAWEAATLQ